MYCMLFPSRTYIHVLTFNIPENQFGILVDHLHLPLHQLSYSILVPNVYLCSKTKQAISNNLLPQEAGDVTGDPDINVVVCVNGNFDGDNSMKSEVNADMDIVGSVVKFLDNISRSAYL